jgi:hypothetical protein
MIDEDLRVALPTDTQLPLAGAHHVVLTRVGAADVLHILRLGAEQPLLTISVSAAGIAVRVTGATVTIEATDLLKLEAKRLVLCALKELSIECAGDLRLQAAGDFSVTATEQVITATRGDVRVVANDDVRLNGERVMMNCD